MFVPSNRKPQISTVQTENAAQILWEMTNAPALSPHQHGILENSIHYRGSPDSQGMYYFIFFCHAPTGGLNSHQWIRSKAPDFHTSTQESTCQQGRCKRHEIKKKNKIKSQGLSYTHKTLLRWGRGLVRILFYFYRILVELKEP